VFSAYLNSSLWDDDDDDDDDHAIAAAAFMNVLCCRNEEITKRFSELDRDRNGVLSPDEVISVIRDTMGYDQQRAVSLVQIFDQNQDGSLDKTEFMHLWAGIFG